MTVGSAWCSAATPVSVGRGGASSGARGSGIQSILAAHCAPAGVSRTSLSSVRSSSPQDRSQASIEVGIQPDVHPGFAARMVARSVALGKPPR